MGGATGLGRSDSTCLRLGNGECWSTLAAVGVLDTVGLRVCNVLSLFVNLISGLLPSLLGECLKMVKASFSLCARAEEARLWDAARIAPGSILKKISLSWYENKLDSNNYECWARCWSALSTCGITKKLLWLERKRIKKWQLKSLLSRSSNVQNQVTYHSKWSHFLPFTF